MTNEEMFEKSFMRPSNFFELSLQEQQDIDKNLGILEWDGSNMSTEDIIRFRAHYDKFNREK